MAKIQNSIRVWNRDAECQHPLWFSNGPASAYRDFRLVELDLGGNGIKGEGLRALAAHLRQTSQLQYLGLAQTSGVDMTAWAELFDSLRTNDSLHHIILDESDLGNFGAQMFAQMLMGILRESGTEAELRNGEKTILFGCCNLKESPGVALRLTEGMSCLCRKVTSLPMDTVRIIPSENLPHSSSSAVFQPQRTTHSQSTLGGDGSEGATAVHKACSGNTNSLSSEAFILPSANPSETNFCNREGFQGQQGTGSAELQYHSHLQRDVGDPIVSQYALNSSSSILNYVVTRELLTCPTCSHTYNFTSKRPRVLSCLHSVCEECLQILYESCPKYMFISCPTCSRETVLFTDYGLAALAVNTSILNRLPSKGGSLASNSTEQCEGEENKTCFQMLCQHCQSACACRCETPLSFCVLM
ncbi:RING finger protein 208 [Arapaima gigas]